VLIDSVEMELNYVTDYESQRLERMTLVFERCSKVEFAINPGFDGTNPLLGEEEEDVPGRRRIRIEKNTTAGVIVIEYDHVYMRKSTHRRVG